MHAIEAKTITRCANFKSSVNLSPTFIIISSSFLCSHIQFLFERVPGVSKATIIDLDAHQVSNLPVFSTAYVLLEVQVCDKDHFSYSSIKCQFTEHKVNHGQWKLLTVELFNYLMFQWADEPVQ